MSDIHGDRVNRPRDEGLYVARIGEEKKEKQKYSEIPPERNKQILTASFFSYLQNIFNTFSGSKKMAGKALDLRQMVDHLTEFKNLLLSLQEEDHSQEIPFVEKLSTIWIILLEDMDALEIFEKKGSETLAQFRRFLDGVKNHPPESDHCFGYYLLNHAGADWLPFPFMEILKDLHDEKKTLSSWCLQIDEVSNEIQADLDRFKL